MPTEINLPTKATQDAIKQDTTNILNQFPISGGKILRSKVFKSSGTFVVPEGVTEVFLTGTGAGGSGSYWTNSGNTFNNGNAGGATSFGSLLTLSGGGGGRSNLGGLGAGAGGDGMSPNAYAKSGGSGFSTGGETAAKGGYGAGGGGAGGNQSSGGGAGDYIYDYPVSVTPGSSISVTIGNGGAAGGYSSDNMSGAGGKGLLIVKWWE